MYNIETNLPAFNCDYLKCASIGLKIDLLWSSYWLGFHDKYNFVLMYNWFQPFLRNWRFVNLEHVKNFKSYKTKANKLIIQILHVNPRKQTKLLSHLKVLMFNNQECIQIGDTMSPHPFKLVKIWQNQSCFRHISIWFQLFFY